MRRPSRTTLAASLLVVLGVLSWLVLGRNGGQPVYAGKPLSHWLRAVDATSPSISWRDANRAIHQAGTNGIPVYLDLVKAVDSPLKLQLIALAGKQSFVKIPFSVASTLRREAEYGFNELGVRAEAAVPALIRLYRSTPDPDSKAAIARILGNMGPGAKEALPLLRAESATTNAWLHSHIMDAVQNIDGTGPSGDWQASYLRSTVNDGLRDIDTRRQADAARQLYSRDLFGLSRAGGAVPVLLELLGQPRTNSYWIRFALEELNPDAAASDLPARSRPSDDPDPQPANPAGRSELALAPCDSGRLQAVGEWSEPANDRIHKLRGRLLVYDSPGNSSAGRPWREAAVFMELQEVTGALNFTPATLRFDAREALEPVLHDAHSGLVPSNSAEPQDLCKPQWIIVPFDGSVRFPVGVLCETSSADAGDAMVHFGARTWSVGAAKVNGYSLSAKFTPPKDVKSPLDYDVWSGTLELPPVRLPGRDPEP